MASTWLKRRNLVAYTLVVLDVATVLLWVNGYLFGSGDPGESLPWLAPALFLLLACLGFGILLPSESRYLKSLSGVSLQVASWLVLMPLAFYAFIVISWSSMRHF